MIPTLPAGEWENAACRTEPQLWDYAIDVVYPGGWHHKEPARARRARHAAAKAACKTCPALAACSRLPIDGLSGIIAGRLVNAG